MKGKQEKRDCHSFHRPKMDAIKDILRLLYIMTNIGKLKRIKGDWWF